MARVQISINDDLLEKIDTYADSNFMSRSSLICMCMSQFLASKDLGDALRSMGAVLQQVADSGAVTDEALNDLEKMMESFQSLNLM